MCLLNKLVLWLTTRNILSGSPHYGMYISPTYLTCTFHIANLEFITAWLNRVRQADVFDDFRKLRSEFLQDEALKCVVGDFSIHISLAWHAHVQKLISLELTLILLLYTAVLTLDNTVVDLDAIEALYENVSMLTQWKPTLNPCHQNNRFAEYLNIHYSQTAWTPCIFSCFL